MDLFLSVIALIKTSKKNRENALLSKKVKPDIVTIIDFRSVPAQITMAVFQSTRIDKKETVIFIPSGTNGVIIT